MVVSPFHLAAHRVRKPLVKVAMPSEPGFVCCGEDVHGLVRRVWTCFICDVATIKGHWNTLISRSAGVATY